MRILMILLFSMIIDGKQFIDKEEANKYIKFMIDKLQIGNSFMGEYCDFKYEICKEVKNFTNSELVVCIKGKHSYERELGVDNVRIIHNALLSMNEYKKRFEDIVGREQRNYNVLQEEYNKPFEYNERLEKLTERKRQLTELLYEKDKLINDDVANFNSQIRKNACL